MYVADMTMADAEATLSEVMAERQKAFESGFTGSVEQLDWDIEDLANHILNLRAEAKLNS